MAILVNGVGAEDPLSLADWCASQTPPLPTDRWRNKAGTFTLGPGRDPGRGWAMLRKSALDALTLTSDLTLTFSGTTTAATVALSPLTLLNSECVTPGSSADANAVYLCEFVDRRHHLARVPLPNGYAAYNVTNAAGDDYLSATLNSGTPYTWDEVVDALATILGESTTEFNLPFTPDGTPENLVFDGCSAWEALNRVLDRIACAPAYDPITDTFSVVRLGSAADTELDAVTAARTWDGYSSEPVRGWRPEKVRVRFLRRPQPTDGSSPYYTADVTLTATTGVVAGTYAQLDDDATAEGASGSPTNAAALATRAAERAADWLRKRRDYDRPVLRAWKDFVPGATGLAGYAVAKVVFDDRGEMQTWAGGDADRALEEFRPLGEWPAWWPLASATSGITAEEVDGSPSYTGTTTLRFDSADGFVLSQPGAGITRVDLNEATISQNGIVTTTSQTWSGAKTVRGDVTAEYTNGTTDTFRIAILRTATGGTGYPSVYYYHDVVGGAHAGTYEAQLSFIDDGPVSCPMYLGTTWCDVLGGITGPAGTPIVAPQFGFCDGSVDPVMGSTTVTGGLTFKGGILVSGSFSGGTGTVTSVNLTAPAAGITVSGGPVTTSGSITLALADDLAALEALSGTNTIYYRSGASTWSAVTIGSNLTFSGGTLNAAGGGTPGGSDTHVQFNDGGAFGGQSDLTFDKTGLQLTVPGLTGTKDVLLTGYINPTSFSTPRHDWAPTNFDTAFAVAVTTTASTDITGIAGGADGRIIFLYNATASYTITLKNVSGSSSAGNQFFLAADLALPPGAGVVLLYRASYWRAVGAAGESAAAGTLTGATLASNVLASSLTSVGTLTGGATGAGFTIALSTSTVTGLLGLARGGANADLSGTGPGVLRQASAGANVTVGQALDLIILKDVKAATTEGGSNTGGSYQTRTLNTESVDTGSHCTLASNQFTLTAGTYRIFARAPAYRVGRHQIKLRNATDSTDVCIGTPAYSENANNVQGWAWIEDRFTIGASKALEIQHYTTTSVTTQGFGLYGDGTNSTTYTVVVLWKEL